MTWDDGLLGGLTLVIYQDWLSKELLFCRLKNIDCGEVVQFKQSWLIALNGDAFFNFQPRCFSFWASSCHSSGV